jgi:hypothetical protein
MTKLFNDAPVAAPDKSADFHGGHWYSHNENGWFPLYEPGKNFTLREARKVAKEGRVAVPSVTTYFKVLHKQTLVDWLIGQHLDVALRTPVAQFNNTEEWKDHVCNVASNSSKGAADLGTSIHAAIEQAVGGEDYDASMESYVAPVMAKRAELGLQSMAQEKAVGSLKYGYGGKVDDICAGTTIVDYKSRKSRKAKVASYSTDEIQTAAYGFAHFGNDFFKHGRGLIFGISTTEPGVITVHEFTGPALVPAFEAFLGLMQVWRFEHTFDPRIAGTGVKQ